MARNFRELEAKMSAEAQARSKALADQYRASGEVPPQVSEILEKALALSSYERGVLIDLLTYTTLDIEPNEPAEEGVEAAWDEEIKRRVDDIRSGQVKTIPGEQVLAESARWFEKLDEFGPEPFGLENRRQPILKPPKAPRRSRRG